MNYPFADLLIHSQRQSGTRRPLTLIDPTKYHAFFQRLLSSELTPELKAFLAVAVSGGLRVSEALGIQVMDLRRRGYVTVQVLKKRKFVPGKHGPIEAHAAHKEIRLHPIAIQLLEAHLLNEGRRLMDRRTFKRFSLVFDYSRNDIHLHIKRVFGPDACSHSIVRHSYISWLLHEKELPVATVAKLVDLSPRIVENYSHVNRRAILEGIYEDMA